MRTMRCTLAARLGCVPCRGLASPFRCSRNERTESPPNDIRRGGGWVGWSWGGGGVGGVVGWGVGWDLRPYVNISSPHLSSPHLTSPHLNPPHPYPIPPRPHRTLPCPISPHLLACFGAIPWRATRSSFLLWKRPLQQGVGASSSK